jgi:hypothetical protein
MTKPVIYEFPAVVPDYYVEGVGTVNFEVTYSAGENENELEFEWISVSENNNLTEDQICDIESALESGLEDEFVENLTKYYADSDTIFIDPRYL